MGCTQTGGTKRPFAGEPPGIDEIYAFGRYDLKLSEEEFWNMNPLQYNLLVERHNKKIGYKPEQAAIAQQKPWEELKAKIMGNVAAHNKAVKGGR